MMRRGRPAARTLATRAPALALLLAACGTAATGAATSGAAPVAPAAASGYALGGDTLRFREVSNGDVRITAPTGDFSMKSEHDATIALARVAGDTARAWYEALALGVTSPMGAQRPATDAALRQPFTLRMDPRGRVTVLGAPTFPASFRGVSDLTHQFDDFFPRLPAEPLRVGLAWTDTVTRADSSADRVLRSRSIGTFRVERDTVVNGVAAFVVDMRQQVDIGSSAAMPQGGRAEVTQSGTETGWFVFAPRAGRLVARRRKGQLDGEIATNGAMGTSRMKQSYGYTSSIDLLP